MILGVIVERECGDLASVFALDARKENFEGPQELAKGHRSPIAPVPEAGSLSFPLSALLFPLTLSFKY